MSNLIITLSRYGCRGNDCRSNIHIARTGDIVYFVGPVVVLYNKGKHQQRHYVEHTQDIRRYLENRRV